MFLSGGVGFQSTQVMPRSFFLGAKTSTASAFFLPGSSVLVTSNSYVRYVPATSSASATFWPLSQLLARQLIPRKFSHPVLPLPSGTVNSVRYHQEQANGLPFGMS